MTGDKIKWIACRNELAAYFRADPARQHIPARKVASRFGCSAATVNRARVKVFGAPPPDRNDREQRKEAARLVLDPALSIAEVARQTGLTYATVRLVVRNLRRKGITVPARLTVGQDRPRNNGNGWSHERPFLADRITVANQVYLARLLPPCTCHRRAVLKVAPAGWFYHPSDRDIRIHKTHSDRKSSPAY